MKKTTLLLDESLARRAQEILGTASLRATIDRSLKEVLERDARQRAVLQLVDMDGIELDQDAVMDQAWR